MNYGSQHQATVLMDFAFTPRWRIQLSQSNSPLLYNLQSHSNPLARGFKTAVYLSFSLPLFPISLSLRIHPIQFKPHFIANNSTRDKHFKTRMHSTKIGVCAFVWLSCFNIYSLINSSRCSTIPEDSCVVINFLQLIHIVHT